MVKFFSRTNDPRTFILFWTKEDGKTTWGWSLSFSFYRADEARWWPIAFSRSQGFAERSYTLRVPPLGYFYLVRQNYGF